MRRLLAVILMLGIAGVASAANLGNHAIVPDKATYVGDGLSDGREGGENFGSALLIPGLPYSDSGATCDNVQDVFLTCAANSAPDVFYRFVPATNMSVNFSLCGSGYDTALGIFQGTTEIACNDDFCGLQSEIDNVNLTAGQTYYIDVSGFSTACGSYVIYISENVPCVLECPGGALHEGEPPCGDNYYDGYNGGCNSTGFQPLCPQTGDSAVMCGKSGTYLYFGSSYRDTDWYKVWGCGGTMCASVQAEFPVQLIFIYGLDCNAPTYDITTAAPCQTAQLCRYVAAGTYVWIWVGASQFNGIPCESDYILTMTGICFNDECGTTPVESKSWGAIKNLYK